METSGGTFPRTGPGEKKMAQRARRKARYEDLCNLPDHLVGEIVNGELVATPRPLYRHGRVAAGLMEEVGPPYQRGRGGPGGWWILPEPEIHLGDHVLVPDLAGWRRERMPALPEGNWTSLPPDWVCEILSPGTVRLDRVIKVPIYGESRVGFLWLVDPGNRSLEVFRLEANRWLLLGSFAETDKARAEPFQEIEIDLADLWAG